MMKVIIELAIKDDGWRLQHVIWEQMKSLFSKRKALGSGYREKTVKNQAAEISSAAV